MKISRVIIATSLLAVAMIVLAATANPVICSNVSDSDDLYLANTIEVKNGFTTFIDSVTNQLENNIEYNQETNRYSISSAGSIVGYNDEETPITFSLNPENGTLEYSDEFSEKINGIDDYYAVYGNDKDIVDVVVVIGNDVLSLKEYYDPIEHCFAYVAIPIVATIPGIGWIIAAVMVIVGFYYVYQYVNENGETIEIDVEDVVDGIQVGKDSSGRIIAVSITGTDYTLNNTYVNTRPNDGSYYFALLYNSVIYVFPKAISYSTAENVMKMNDSSNKGGRFSIYTYHQSNAYNVSATALGATPHGPEIDGSPSNGYLWHYHTNDHRTPAHAFYMG